MTAPRIWLFGDYNQAESRVVAWRGPVKNLKKGYQEGRDVHLDTTKMIAKVIQENNVKMPIRDGQELFKRKHWNEYIKKDEEREQVKRIIHGGNYEVGIKKVAMILGVPEPIARVLLGIYFTLNPDIRTGYHAWIRKCVTSTRMIWTPEPVPFRKVFWDILNDDTFREAYASYPQSTVGALLNRTLAICANIFRNDIKEELRDQWCAWYGRENWDTWCIMRDRGDRSPKAILWSGMDIRLNVHDAGGISVPEDDDLIMWAATTWKKVGEVPIYVTKEDPLIIPIEFKKGKTWHGDDLEEYKVPLAA